jgi:hypothetical protein
MTTAQNLASLSQLFSTTSLGYRNKVINGNFDIWQRGTSLSSGTSVRYLADRFMNDSIGSTYTVSQQTFTLGQTAVSGEPKFFHRTVVTSSAGAGNCANFQHRLEGVRTFAGQTATLSFWAKADASKNIAVELYQYFGSGGSPSAGVDTSATTLALTTNWTKYTVTISVPSITGKTLGTDNGDWLGVTIWYEAGSNFNSRTNSLGQQSGTFDIAQVQFESGNTTTVFEQRPLAVEVVLCQRYFEAISTNGIMVYNQGSTGALMDVVFQVSKRGNPSLTYVGSMPSGEYTNTPTSVGLDRIQTGRAQVLWTGTGGPAAATCGRMLVGGTMQFSAEL